MREAILRDSLFSSFTIDVIEYDEDEEEDEREGRKRRESLHIVMSIVL